MSVEDIQQKLETWLRQFPADHLLLIPDVVKIIGGDPIEFGRALVNLSKTGKIRQVFYLKYPSGRLFPTTFDTLQDMPDILPDEDGKSFITDDAQCGTAYRVNI